MTPLLTETRGRVAIASLNRPAARNALNTALLRALAETLAEWDAQPAVRVVVITGGQSVFSAGMDLKELAGMAPADLPSSQPYGLFERICQTRKPLIAAVCGWALGGGLELALACDMIVASTSARFGMPEVSLGLMPSLGGTQRLPALLGHARAAEIILANRTLTAEEACQWGLINCLASDDRCLDEALKLAERVAAHPPLAVQLAKASLRRLSEPALLGGMRLERQGLACLLASADGQEGLQAFIQKRQPGWKGEAPC